MKKSILIWVGYHSKPWDIQDWINYGKGGSEVMAIKLAYRLKDLGYNVTISGGVKTNHKWGIDWINEHKFLEYFGPIGLTNPHSVNAKNHYNTVIGVNYIHFIRHIKDLNVTFDDAWFWMHNESYHRWYRGGELDDYKQYFKNDKLRGIIGVSDFHKKYLQKEASKLFDYTTNDSNTYIHSIDNAIDLDDYKVWKGRNIVIDDNNKIPDRIIWTSSADRGLDFILENWESWKQKVPGLSLAILSPPYSVGWFDKSRLDKLKDIEWLGNKCPLDVKKEIAKSTYWIYSSDYIETYCISALEMMMGKVKIITNGTGNIKNLVNNDRGTLIKGDENEVIEAIISDKINPDNMNRKTVSAYEFAKQHNWDIRVNEWINLLNL